MEEGLRISFQLVISDSRKLTTYFAFCYPYSYGECQRRLARLDEQFRQPSLPQAQDEIYYHRLISLLIQVPRQLLGLFNLRELLCRSLEGRRIDLITVTSWEGVSEEREPRLPHLFPDEASDRCYVFRNKKVIVRLASVHKSC